MSRDKQKKKKKGKKENDVRQERETRNRNKRINVRERAKDWTTRKEKRERSERGGYIYTQSRTMIRKSAVRIPPGEIWVADRQREDGMRGTDGEEVAGLRGGRGEERGGEKEEKR